MFNENIYKDLMWVHARKCVFLGAGSLGTTEILLRSKRLGLPMSDRIGQNMSGNGDVYAFGYGMDSVVNAIGREDPLHDFPVGPTVTGAIDCRDQENPLDGFVIQEGAVPEACTPWLQSMLELIEQRKSGLERPFNLIKFLERVASLILGPYYARGALEKTQIYLVMSHDSNQVRL